MNYFRQLAGLREYCKKSYAQRQCEKYCDLMLTGQLCIWDVPLKWRRNPNTAMQLYVTGFRIARGTSPEQYAEDLAAFETELYLFKEIASCNPVLWGRLDRLYRERRAELDDCQRISKAAWTTGSSGSWRIDNRILAKSRSKGPQQDKKLRPFQF